MRRYEARLALGVDEVARTVDDVEEGARRVLLVDSIGAEPGDALESLQTIRDRMADGADVRLLCPEYVGSGRSGWWRRTQRGERSAVVRMMRRVGWTVVAVERFSVEGYDGNWVDIAAGEVVPRAHGDG